MNLPVTTTPEADAQIRAIDDWKLFLDELVGAFESIVRAPIIGRLYWRSPVLGVRGSPLRATRCHVYCVPGLREVRVLAIWHGERGVGPPLRRR